MLLAGLSGCAHALVFGVFLVAAAGKLAACRPGMRVMCGKGALDAVLALLAGLAFLPGTGAAGMAGAAVAVAVGAGGWLREKIRRNTVCNCFGVLTAVLHPWRNGARAALFGGGLLALALAPYRTLAGAASWGGAVLALAGLLALMALAFSRPFARGSATAPKAVATLAEGTISPATPVGRDADGTPLALRDLAVPGRPLALLMVSPGCKPCHLLKKQIEPLLSGLPFGLLFVIEDDAAAQASPAGIFDADKQWRKTLGVKSVPSLVIVNEDATNIAAPVATTPDAIFLQLLRLAAQSAAIHPAQARQPGLAAIS